MKITKEEIENIREKFPILRRKVGDKDLIYLDNTATSQTPLEVVEDINYLYTHTKANVHRGVHTLSQEATDLQEHTRRRVQGWINASSFEEIIFTRGTTEAINLVASSFGQRFKEGDEIILTVMEHHANIVPWQLLQSRTGIKIRVVDINDKGELDLDQYRSLFNDRTVFASFTHISNVLGTVNPVREMTRIAHEHGVPVLVDGAQAAPHLRPDMQDIGCDFYVFSAHKMYGPTGIGVLYGRKELLESMPPYQGGGEMIKHVSFEHTTFADLPFKFEAGTPDFVGIAAFAKAFDFMEETGIDLIAEHEPQLLEYTTEQLLAR
ncbi:MAG: cysteine desulfurase, partial [Muribaculaceae bacterium]|nr:cysteine desulfurase [Muribaculaceae bacterium]